MAFENSLFDTLLEPVFVLSSDGRVVYCNEPAALICELSVRKITRGLNFKDLLSFAEHIDWLQNLHAVTTPQAYKEVNYTAHSGQGGKVQITAQPHGDDQWIVFVRDVTLEERLQKKYRAELEQKEDVILDLQKAQAELEKYSKNLEQMVQDRTQEISRINRLMKALLDSLSQGFFVFDAQGKVLEVSSKACEQTVEAAPSGKNIWEVLKLPESKIHGFQRWMTTVFSEMLPFEDLAPLGPAQYPHSQGNHISLEYFPLRTDQQQIDGVVVVATDITNLVEAQRQAKIEKHFAEMILTLVRTKNQVGRFLRESSSLLQELQTALLTNDFSVESVFRCLHTLKGGAGMLSVLPMAEACHLAENTLASYGELKSPALAATLRTQCLDVASAFAKFKEEAQEILGHAILSDQRTLEIPLSHLESALQEFAGLPGGPSLVTKVLAQFTEDPVLNFFVPYSDTAKTLAAKQNKLLNPIRFVGADLTVTPEVYNSLFASFVHAFRNAVDHGLEFPEERLQHGKPESGQIVVTFELTQSSEKLRICVQDDGRGIDPKKIRSKLEAKFKADASMIRRLQAEADSEVIQHVFDSQFSTKEVVTEISGRGVGLDAIKSEAELLGGRAWVESTLNLGSRVIVEVPLIKKRSAAKEAKAA